MRVLFVCLTYWYENLTVKIPVLRDSDAIFFNWISWNFKEFQYDFWAIVEVKGHNIHFQSSTTLSDPSLEDFLLVLKIQNENIQLAFLANAWSPLIDREHTKTFVVQNMSIGSPTPWFNCVSLVLNLIFPNFWLNIKQTRFLLFHFYLQCLNITIQRF